MDKLIFSLFDSNHMLMDVLNKKEQFPIPETMECLNKREV